MGCFSGRPGRAGAHEVGQEHAACAAAAVLRLRCGDLLAFVGAFGAVRAFEAAVRADPADRRQVQWRRIPHALDTAAREEADALRAEVLARQEEAFTGLGARYRAIAAAEAGNQPHAIPPRPDFGRYRPLSDRAFLLVQRALIDAGAAGRAGSRCRSAGGPRSAAGAAGCSGVPQ
ncbi:hypothetical protein SS50377_26143 [Spironucleus salmonicida]|uniref:Uncharacterized protein n=1 Tax=Spironucleus salmonicida TaxID=348837 RepID=A0A9P8LPL1_9EUKA|nr:hypothetical protein SS50377_26143 [Spironucleus salmonicida]